MSPEFDLFRYRTFRFFRQGGEPCWGASTPRALAGTALALNRNRRATACGGNVRLAKLTIVIGRKWYCGADVGHGSDLNPCCF